MDDFELLDDSGSQVGELKQRYVSARKAYYKDFGHSPPSFREMERYALARYSEQAESYDATTSPRYEDGVVPHVVGWLAQRSDSPTPRAESSKLPQEGLRNLALYPCLRAIARLPEKLKRALLEADDDWATQSVDDDEIRSLALAVEAESER